MWPYAARYATELTNHYPTTALADSKTPHQMLLEYMGVPNPIPNLCALRKFGEAGWVHIPEQRRVQSDKFSARATKAYFVGREGSRIYLMWDLEHQKLIRTSSVKWATAQLLEISHSVTQDVALTAPHNAIPPVQLGPQTPLPSPEITSMVPGARGEGNESIIEELDDFHLSEVG